jgi:Mg/Co/Ni transporter MgtE
MLATLSTLVLFVPTIMAMGGNSGIQTSTVTVRSLATGVLHNDDV